MTKEYFVLEKADMVHALGLIMPYGAYLVPFLKKMPVEELNKVYEANMQQAREYNHMQDRVREAQTAEIILKRRLASFERTSKRKPTTSRDKVSNRT